MAKWQNYVTKALEAKERFNDISGTFSDGTTPPKSTDKKLKFDVIEVLPNRDNKKDIYLLSGTQESLAQQLSLFIALEELITVRIGNLDIKTWFDSFAGEFQGWELKGRATDSAVNPYGRPYAERGKLVLATPPKDLVVSYFTGRFFPNRDDELNYYWVSGSANQILEQVMHITHMEKMLIDKDFGQFLGYPADDYYALKPASDVSIRLFFTNRKTPPYYKGSSITFFAKSEMKISNVDESKLNYQYLRQLCNGSSGLKWGHWTARANVALDAESKPISQIHCHGDDHDTAIENLRRFLPLTKSKVKSMNCTKAESGTELAKADPYWKEKEKYEIYPCFLTIVNPVKIPIVKGRGGRATTSGTIKTKRIRLWLNQQNEPQGWTKSLREVLSNRVE